MSNNQPADQLPLLADHADYPIEHAYYKTYTWEVEMEDLTTQKRFSLLVVADDFTAATTVAVWAAASEYNDRRLDDYLVIRVERQRRVTY